MSKIHVLCIGGTSEVYSSGKLANGGFAVPKSAMHYGFANRLKKEIFEPEWIVYPADYGANMSYRESVDIGIDATFARMREIVGADPQAKFILSGYSQGAAVAQILAERICSEKDFLKGTWLLGTANIASPYRRQGTSITGMPPTPGFGLAGPGMYLGDKIFQFELVAPGDPISTGMNNSKLRQVAVLSEWMSAKNPAKWVEKMIEATLEGRVGTRRSTFVESVQAWSQAWPEVQRYLPWSQLNPNGGRHTCYATERSKVDPRNRTYTDILADTLNWKYREQVA